MAICKEKEIFRNNYTKFCNIVKQEDGLHPYLVEKQIISTDDLAEIRSVKVGEKGPTLLRHISSPLEAGQTKGFYGLLEVMREHGRLDTRKFAKGIQRKCQPNSNEGSSEDEADLEDKPTEETVKENDQSITDKVKTGKEEPLYGDNDLKKKYDSHKAKRVMLQYDKLDSQQKNIVAKVQAMIVVVNDNEFMATMCYLAPPDNQNAVLSIQCKAQVGPDSDPRIFHVGNFGQCPVAVTQVKQGRGKDAVYHAKKECFKNLVLIAAVGVAAGFPKNGVKLGDVLISDQIRDCAICKQQDNAYIPRGNILPASKFMINLLGDHFDWNFPCTKEKQRNSAVKFGLILSKPVLLDDADERDRLLQYFGKEAKGFEMEGFGIMDSSMSFIVIKGVCDLGANKSKEWQPTAALAANDYLHHHFSQTDLSSLLENNEQSTDMDTFSTRNMVFLILALIFVTVYLVWYGHAVYDYIFQ